MAGSRRVPAHVIHLHDHQPPLLGRGPPHPALIEDPRLRHLRHLPLPHPHHAILAIEERLAAQHREIQALLFDNQRLAATHVALKQELSASQHELRLVASAAVKAKADRDAEVREIYERSVKIEAEARSIEGMRAELAQVGSDVKKLGAARDEMVERLQTLKGELARARADNGQARAIRAEIETMQSELQRGRNAVEYEKKAHADNLEQSQAMEKNMISMAREVEKLRAELANAEKRARAAAAATAAANPGPGYAGTYGNSEMAYGGGSYAESYGMRQVQSGADGGSQYGAGAVSHGSYNMQRTHAHR